MAAGFADILGTLGVWLSGRRVAVPTATPSEPARQSPGRLWSGRHGGGNHPTFAFDYQDEDALRLVDEAIRETLKREKPRKRVATTPAPVFLPAVPELESAIDRLFEWKTLASLDDVAKSRARSALDAAMRQIEWDAAWAAFAAQQEAEADEEMTALLLLL